MKKKVLILGSLAILSVAYVLFGQSAGTAPRPASTSTVSSAQAVPVGSAQRKMLDQYCVTCHNEDDRVANLTIDKLDPAHVSQDAQTWEKVVRKLRAGMMPPSGNPRPDRAATMALVGWLENELDKSAVAYMPPPGLHRLNRTEYANVIRDLLDLEIDPGKYLPTDDSTRGFDNIAGALGLSSTLVESYVSAAGKISRLAMGDATTPSLVVYRAPEDTSQDYHVLGMPMGTRGGILVKHVFPSDGEYTITVTPIFGDNMSPRGLGRFLAKRSSSCSTTNGSRSWTGRAVAEVVPAIVAGALVQREAAATVVVERMPVNVVGMPASAEGMVVMAVLRPREEPR